MTIDRPMPPPGDPAEAPGDADAAGATGPLDLSGLEAVYDALADGIDRAGSERSETFLVKLALLNAQALGDPALVRRHIDIALRDL